MHRSRSLNSVGEIDWGVVSVLVGVAMAWGGVLLWAVKVLLDRNQRHSDRSFELINERFEELKKDTEAESKQWQRIERDLLELRADMPLNYVRREDWIRFSSVIDAKQDTLNEKINRLLERKP